MFAYKFNLFVLVSKKHIHGTILIKKSGGDWVYHEIPSKLWTVIVFDRFGGLKVHVSPSPALSCQLTAVITTSETTKMLKSWDFTSGSITWTISVGVSWKQWSFHPLALHNKHLQPLSVPGQQFSSWRRGASSGHSLDSNECGKHMLPF